MKSVALSATGTKPDLIPGASGVVAFGVEIPMGTQGAAKDDCVTVWFCWMLAWQSALRAVMDLHEDRR